jgi:hypothetical protein
MVFVFVVFFSMLKESQVRDPLSKHARYIIPALLGMLHLVFIAITSNATVERAYLPQVWTKNRFRD